MCGIVGILSTDRRAVEAGLPPMMVACAHRGPDDRGHSVVPFDHGWLGLGHLRLSILDPSPLGHQPMVHEPSGSQIIFNGEIYNFPKLQKELIAEGEQFRSNSDTEVLLAGLVRKGEAFVEQLEGMYAFAYYDARARLLLLARDPAGIKPLYIAHAANAIVFASEVRAILASGLVSKEISQPAVAGYFAYGAVQQPLTLFRSIQMLPPGTWCKISGVREPGMANTRRWWNIPKPAPAPPSDEIIVDTRRLLQEAVSDHLISDVPIGVFLSAGLDSTTIAGLAANKSHDVQTFTVGFADQPEFDEAQIAARTAKRFGLPHRAIAVSPAQAEHDAEEWLAAADQPSIDGLNTFIISKAVRQQGIKVALSGLGADELFGGYRSFAAAAAMRRIVRTAHYLPASARSGLSRIALMRRPKILQQKFVDMLKRDSSGGALTLGWRRLLSDARMSSLGIHPAQLGLSCEFLPEAAQRELPNGQDLGWAVSVTETKFYQTNTLLRDSDANGMAHGLEIRVPFLDKRLIEYVHRLPGGARFPKGAPPKWLLRKAASDLLDPELSGRPKSGFVLPLRDWMRGSMREICEGGIATLKGSGIVEPAGVDQLWNDFLRAPESLWARALSICVLGDYLKRISSSQKIDAGLLR
jgi:asparagine synthase (glutamine-hydrolysing)